MQFKNWLRIDEINKGLKRTFIQQHGHLPGYVANQVLQNRISPLWKKTQLALGPTTGHGDVQVGTEKTQPVNRTVSGERLPYYGKMGDIYRNPSVSAITANIKWTKLTIDLHPTDFTQNTIEKFLSHEFGSSPVLGTRVKNHSQRMQTQAQLAQTRGEDNEPIIVIKIGDKYEMQEGWHRLYTYLTQYSAPPQEVEKIKNNRSNEVDLSKWKRIKVKAWVGENPTQGYVTPRSDIQQFDPNSLSPTLA